MGAVQHTRSVRIPNYKSWKKNPDEDGNVIIIQYEYCQNLRVKFGCKNKTDTKILYIVACKFNISSLIIPIPIIYI